MVIEFSLCVEASDIKLVSLYSTTKMMHGPINIRFTFSQFLISELNFLVPAAANNYANQKLEPDVQSTLYPEFYQHYPYVHSYMFLFCLTLAFTVSYRTGSEKSE